MSTSRSIQAVIRTITPMHVASFAAKDGTKTKMTAMRVLTQDGFQYVPYFPANDLKGRMRRVASERVRNAASDPVSLPLYQVLSNGSKPGGLAGKDNERTTSVTKTLAEIADLYLGSFGGGDNLTPSGMSVSDIVPITPGMAALKQVPRDIEATFACKTGDVAADFPNLTWEFTFTKRDEVMRGTDISAINSVNNYVTAATAYMQQVLAVNDKRKSDKTAAKAAESKEEPAALRDGAVKKLDADNIFSCEAIIPGVPMFLRIDFADHMSDAHIALVAECLKETLATHLGGYSRIHFGRVDLVQMTYLHETDGVEVSKINLLTEHAPGADSMAQALNHITVPYLNTLFGIDPKIAGKVEQ